MTRIGEVDLAVRNIAPNQDFGSHRQTAGAARVEAQALLLPLRCDLNKISRALGVVVCQGGGDRTMRFDLTSSALRPVMGDGVQRGIMTTAKTTTAPGLAESQSGYKTRVPYLRLVKSDC